MTAIAAGYMALFGILPFFGLPFALGALICGMVALKQIERDPRFSGRGRAWFGIIVGSLMIVVSGLVAIIFILNPRLF